LYHYPTCYGVCLNCGRDDPDGTNVRFTDGFTNYDFDACDQCMKFSGYPSGNWQSFFMAAAKRVFSDEARTHEVQGVQLDQRTRNALGLLFTPQPPASRNTGTVRFFDSRSPSEGGA